MEAGAGARQLGVQGPLPPAEAALFEFLHPAACGGGAWQGEEERRVPLDERHVVLLVVYDGQPAGRHLFYAFSARLLREEGEWFVARISRSLRAVPWVQRERKRRLGAGCQATGPPTPCH
ncbi:hypothetical protein ABPG75_004535 [Micractinium tetrahymenae]